METPCRVTAELNRYEREVARIEARYEARLPEIERRKGEIIEENLRSADFWVGWLESLDGTRQIASMVAAIMGRLDDACSGDEFAREAILRELHLLQRDAVCDMERSDEIERQAEREAE